MTELAGFPELTPYGGGWCGNEVGSEFFSDHHRELARRYTQQMGDRLRQEGYRGYFELDFLVDAASGELYLGELNPRVTGASSMTNVTAVAYGDMPLFLFHLLEYMDVEYEIDVDELNTRWARAQNVDAWSQFILKQVEDDVERIVEAPPSGIWRMADNGAITYVRRDTDWHTVVERAGGLLPADRRRRRLPVPRRRPRHPRHARPVHGRRPRARRPRTAAGSRASRGSSAASRSRTTSRGRDPDAGAVRLQDAVRSAIQ